MHFKTGNETFHWQ